METNVGAFIVTEDPPEVNVGAWKGAARLPIPSSGNGASYHLLEAFTLSIWIKPTPSAQTGTPLVQLGSRLQAYIPSGGVNAVRVIANTGSLGTLPVAESPVFTPGKWCHLVVSIDAKTGNILGYFNGSKFMDFEGRVGHLTLPLIDQLRIGSASGVDWISENSEWQEAYATDVTFSGVKVWNYSMSPTQLQALYQRPNYRACKAAFIEGEESMPHSSLKRALIVSHTEPGNPLRIFSRQLAGFGIPNTENSQRCLIVAGGEGDRVFDTLIEIDRNDYRFFDNIVFIENSQAWIDRSQNGDVEYPITRKGSKIKRIPTPYDPAKEQSNIDCWIYTHHVAEIPSAMCFITPGEQVWSGLTSFVQGEFDTWESSVGCMIVNDSVEASTPAFINGHFMFSYDWEQRCYIHSDVDTQWSDSDIYTHGHDVLESVLEAEVKSSRGFGVEKFCYISSESFGERTSRGAFIDGSGGDIVSNQAFIYGSSLGLTELNAYIVSTDSGEQNVSCYIGSPSLFKSKRWGFVGGVQSHDSSLGSYVVSEISEFETISSYIGGSAFKFRAVRVFISAQVGTGTLADAPAYVVSEGPHHSVSAFIVTDQPEHTQCYIVNTGNLSGRKSAFILG